jgi:predicted TIM-barrel fold metal-dependent hydrolase
MAKRIPGSREEDSWFSEDQLEGLERADEADDLRSPIPTQMVSNGEYLPNPQTDKQKEVEARIKEYAATVSKKLGVSRRKFLASSGGLAASFLAMNEAHGIEYFKVSKEELFEPAARGVNGPPDDVFVFDDQLHTVRSSREQSGQGLRAIAAGIDPNLSGGALDENGKANEAWNPAVVGLPNTPEAFQLVQFMKDVYLDSQITIGVLSNNTASAVPGIGGTRPPKNIAESQAGELLTSAQTIAVRNWVNEIAGSTRMLAHGQIYPGPRGYVDPLYQQDYHAWQIENLKPDSWKGYTSAMSAKLDANPDSLMARWRLDDGNLAYPIYEIITSSKYDAILKEHPGLRNLCIHKGLSTNADVTSDASIPLGRPVDIKNAAWDWDGKHGPRLNFLIYHSCIRPGFWMLNAYNDVKSGNLREGVPDIIWTTQFLQDCRNLDNVFAELGTTFASCVITFPTVCAHILGQALKYFGEDRVLFGSDSVWYGGPQWQIEALWRFQIPENFPAGSGGGGRTRFGYPQLTETAKRKILGLNNARLYGITNTDGRLTDPPSSTSGTQSTGYHPVPTNFEALIPVSLKKAMEYPRFSRNDRLSTIRRNYLAQGGMPSNKRYGWIRSRT